MEFGNPKLLWIHPSPSWTRLDTFRRDINRKHGLNLKDYHDLHEYSVSDYAFWQDLWEFMGMRYSQPSTKVIAPGIHKLIPEWFPGARLNYAENLLWRDDDGLAITESNESGEVRSYSYRQLREKVRLMAAALRRNGLEAGDRVAAVVANNTNAVVIALATASVGGVFSSTATDMGSQGILDRYRQIKPKFIFMETAAVYAGKHINLVPKATTVALELSKHGLQCTVLLPGGTIPANALKQLPNTVTLEKFLASGDDRPLVFEQLPFNHPLYILYSSGTTGAPKCIVHGAGGVLMQTWKDIALTWDVGMNDTYFQYTTTGWMMWPFMLTGLACGARIVLYEGSPFYPSVKHYLQFIESQDVTVFGTSPRFLSEVQGRGINPLKDIGTFSALRVINSTGAVLTAPLWEWAQAAFGRDKCIVASSGGTDICSGFISAAPTLPNYAGEMQSKSLGMKVEIFDPSGRNIEETGQAGELVCTRPHPSLPIKFWGDDAQHTKYMAAYYSTYPDVWRHGDFIARNPRTRGYIIYGRSDGVLNPSGVRFGSGEIYSALERFGSVIDDSICVGQRRPQDAHERVLLFVKMRDGHKLTPALETEMRETIKNALSPRHVPSFIFSVDEIPYTVNMKKIEIAVKQIVSGSNVQPSGTVANPDSLKLYYKYRDIENFAEKSKAKL
ncbi:acetoacetate-CoA ligase [Peniophora sp. CONT]|nr:acetoacetate-CoA ligase [Peniophora sp. CONT]